MNAAGRAVAMSVRAWRAVRHESAAGVRGRPYVMLNHNTDYDNYPSCSIFLNTYFFRCFSLVAVVKATRIKNIWR